MAMLKFDAAVHGSLPINRLEEAKKFYGEISDEG
jgi:hypothetical protein